MTDTDFTIRHATLSDTDFISDAIIGAEKSGTTRCGLATLFGLDETQLKTYLISMLEEEIEGCELSIDSFLLAEKDNSPVAATAGWVENAGDELPSNQAKANLIGYTFPHSNLMTMRDNAHLMKGLSIERETATLQFEYVYVAPEARGHGLAARLIEAHIEHTKKTHREVTRGQLQVFCNNDNAIGLYERLGFEVKQSYRSSEDDVLSFLPHNEKLLMEILFQ